MAPWRESSEVFQDVWARMHLSALPSPSMPLSGSPKGDKAIAGWLMGLFSSGAPNSLYLSLLIPHPKRPSRGTRQ